MMVGDRVTWKWENIGTAPQIAKAIGFPLSRDDVGTVTMVCGEWIKVRFDRGIRMDAHVTRLTIVEKEPTK